MPRTFSFITKALRGCGVSGIAILLLIGVTLALSSRTEAKVVYTPVNMTISGTGSLNMDLDGDGNSDFVLRSTSQITMCGNRGGLSGSTKLTPTLGDGVVVSSRPFAAILPFGTTIGASSTFYKSQSVVTVFLLCQAQTKDVVGYLGLEFQINGQVHYGWANIGIHARFGTTTGSMTTTLAGFAYETDPGQPIKAGQTSGDAVDSEAPDSVLPPDVVRSP